MLIVTAVSLTTASYAWFTENTTVSVEDIEVTVDASNGIQISTDAQNGKQISQILIFRLDIQVLQTNCLVNYHQYLLLVMLKLLLVL